MPWSANDEEINGLVDSNLKSSPPNPPAVNTAETIRNLLKAYWALSSAQFKEAIEYVDETNSSVFIQDAIAQAQNERILSQDARTAAETAKAGAELALANAVLAQNPLGEYNVATNSPALTAVPPAGADGSYYRITQGGNIGFAGSNFASGAALAVGGFLIKKSSTQYYYQPPSDLALTKVTTLEGLAAKTAEMTALGITFIFRDTAGNVAFAFYNDGSTFPPTSKGKLQPFELSAGVTALIDKNKYIDSAGTNAVTAVKDSAGNVISAVLADGFPYPPLVKTVRKTAAADILFDDQYDYIQGPDVIENAIYGQWGYPVGYYDGECLYVGSVGSGKYGNQGEIKISQKRDDGLIRSFQLGNVRSDISYGPTDDHNVPVIRYDDRAGAASPIMVFQSEHNTHPTRIFRQSSKNVAKFDKSFTTFGANASYTQVNVNGANKNEILVFSRLDSAIPRSWRFGWSIDNGATWIDKAFFAGDGWMYMLGKNNDDATKINIVFYAHPDNSDDHRIFVMVLDWATGAIYAPGSAGSPICADFRAAMASGSFTPIDPRLGALKIVDRAPSTLKTRIWDIGTSISGECLVSYNTFPTGKNMASFNQSRHRVVSFNLDTGVINYDVELRDAGMPIDRRVDVDDWSYFSGNCVMDTKTVCVATYKNQSMLSAGSDINGNDGNTVIETVDLTIPTAPVFKELLRIKNKAGRPIKVSNSPYLLLINPKEFNNFRTFQSCIRVINLNNYI